ncbi:MAG: hypothetical protein ABI835_20395 [Chloroflexota bacterium]
MRPSVVFDRRKHDSCRFTDLVLRTDGVLRDPTVIQWENIDSFRFDRQNKHMLTLNLERRIWTCEKAIYLSISPEAADAVTNILLSQGVVPVGTPADTQQLAAR